MSLINALLTLRRNSPIPTLLRTLHNRPMQPLHPPLRLLLCTMHIMMMLHIPTLNVRHAFVDRRCDLDDVPGVDQAREEAEQAQGEVYERVCAAKAALYPDGQRREDYCYEGKAEIAW